ncbi:MAG: phosphatase PAP2 family protein [Desulfobulbaceae bacterium]|nr:phosphatase PAP2 family protein [Desulfobulbaceae bacterium]
MEKFITLFTGIEAKVLATLLLIAGGIWAFVELADEVIEGETQSLDQKILLLLRNGTDLSDPVGPLWFEEIMRDLTALGGFTILTMLSLAVIGFLLIQQKQGIAMFVAVSVAGGQMLSFLLKYGFDRPRPDLVPHGSFVMTASFPSGHSMLSAVTFLTLGGLLAQYMKKFRLKIYTLSISVLMTLLVGVSRVYLGVHWPTDVLAGWVAGASWALICWFFAFRLRSRGRLEGNLEN